MNKDNITNIKTTNTASTDELDKENNMGLFWYLGKKQVQQILDNKVSSARSM